MAKETTKMVSSITPKIIDNYQKFVPATLKVCFVRVCVPVRGDSCWVIRQ